MAGTVCEDHSRGVSFLVVFKFETAMHREAVDCSYLLAKLPSLVDYSAAVVEDLSVVRERRLAGLASERLHAHAVVYRYVCDCGDVGAARSGSFLLYGDATAYVGDDTAAADRSYRLADCGLRSHFYAVQHVEASDLAYLLTDCREVRLVATVQDGYALAAVAV